MSRFHFGPRYLRAVWITMLVLTIGIAPAQQGPSLRLEREDPVRVGDTVTLVAHGLQDGVSYVYLHQRPDGSSTRRMLPAEDGQLQVEQALNMLGRHVISLTAPDDIEMRFVVEVAPAGARPAGPVVREPAAPDQDEAEQDEAVQDEADQEEAEPALPGQVEQEPDPQGPGVQEPSEPVPAEPEPMETESEPAEAEPEPAVPAPTPPVGDAARHVVESGDLVAYTADGRQLWRLGFPDGLGLSGAVAEHQGLLWVARGHQLLAVSPQTGEVQRRIATSGAIVQLTQVGTNLAVTSEITAATPGERLSVEARVVNGTLQPPAVFDARDASLFEALRLEAQLSDLELRSAIDATNPYLHLQRVRELLADADTAGNQALAQQAAAAAIASANTFYDLSRVARGFADLGLWDRAEQAMAAALSDLRSRGYDTDLITSTDVHERYGLPLRPLERALDLRDSTAAAFWAEWLFRSAGPRLPGASRALREHASLLQGNGDRAGAAVWRERAGGLDEQSLGEMVAGGALALGRVGPYAALALFVAFLALHLALIAKYTRARALAIHQALETGRKVPAWPWTRSIRYYGFTEKLVLALLLVSAYLAIALYAWAEQGEALTQAASAGNLTSVADGALLDGATGDSDSLALVRAYRASRAGDEAAARAALASAQSRAAQEAMAALGQGQLLPTPSPTQLRAAAAGHWTQAVTQAFSRPLDLWDEGLALGPLPGWTWPVVLVLLAVLVALHLVALLIPRPRYAREAPRNFLYHLLALLVPGAGQADELYGLLLLVPWAVFGIDLLMQLGGGGRLGVPFGTSLIVLGAIYLVNVVTWIVELASVNRRLRRLRETQPELAMAFGLRPIATEAPQEPV